MRLKNFLIFIILLIVVILVAGCAPQKTITKEPSQLTANKSIGEPQQQKQVQTAERDDFGCFYSCKFFPEGYPKQMCEDWKAGKEVMWPSDCNTMQYGPCIKLCEIESKNKPQPGNFGNYPNQQAFNQTPANTIQQPPPGLPTSDPEAGSVYIYISDQASCVSNCDVWSHVESRIIRIDDMTGKNWVSFGTFGSQTNQFHNPSHLAIGPDGKIYIADMGNYRIVRIDDMTGKGWTTYDNKNKVGALLGVAFDSKGRIYIAASNSFIRMDDISGNGFTTFGTAGSGVNQFYKLKAVAIDSQDRIYGVDAGNYRIVRIDDMTGKGWIAFAPDANNTKPETRHNWFMEAPHGMFVVER